MDAFEKHEYLAPRRIEIQLAIPTISEPEGLAVDFDLDELTWNEAKFLTDDGSALHTDMSNIPNNTGGIYMFQVKSDILPHQVRYPLYIGRAHYTGRSSYSLRTRCRSYRGDERLSIQKMIKYWGPHLYISYTTLGSNEEIDDIESWLIGTILPAFNSRIDNVSIKEAVSMFN
ncbi:hypothetical protein [Bacillus toyonensis]|uniref:hypothetical protein n=1 Tax=Bacillus TaxID=1386 RepID=UPI000BFD4B27|nr:hypothetical protein [Bacillus toyonensis]PHG70099.1 hypothetical protein COI59_01810 [Bacillus toyonensis]